MRPSDQYKPTAHYLGQVLAYIVGTAKEAKAITSAFDQQALDFAQEALARCDQWTRDHTETSRRNAASNAMAAQALALAPVAGRGSKLRKAIVAYAGAVQALVERGDTVGAQASAETACNLMA